MKIYQLQSWWRLNPEFDFYDFNPSVLNEPIIIDEDIDIPYKNEVEMSLEYSNNCLEYIEYMSKEDQLLLLGYTYLGDRLVNNYLRYPEEVEDQYQMYLELRYGEFNPLFVSIAKLQYPNKEISSKLYKKIKKLSLPDYIQCIEWTINRLNQLIDESPSLFQGCILYRGEKSMWTTKKSVLSHLFSFKSNTVTNISFLSTSLDIDTAKSYASKDCCLKRIELIKERKGILLGPLSYQPGEVEVLLAPGDFKKEKEDKQFNINTIYLER